MEGYPRFAGRRPFKEGDDLAQAEGEGVPSPATGTLTTGAAWVGGP